MKYAHLEGVFGQLQGAQPPLSKRVKVVQNRFTWNRLNQLLMISKYISFSSLENYSDHDSLITRLEVTAGEYKQNKYSDIMHDDSLKTFLVRIRNFMSNNHTNGGLNERSFINFQGHHCISLTLLTESVTQKCDR